MITIIDEAGDKTEVENNELEAKISASWNGLKVTNVVIEKETNAISATVEKLGKNIDCGWIEDYN